MTRPTDAPVRGAVARSGPPGRGRLPWFLTVVLFGTFVSCAGVNETLGFTSMGWVAPGALGAILVLLNASRVSWSFFLCWAPWVVLVAVYGALSTYESGLPRAILILTPLIVGMGASTFRVDTRDLDTVFTALVAFSVAFVLVFLARVVLVPPELRALFPAEAITALLLASVLASRYLMTKDRGVLLIWGLTCMVPVLAVTRLATLVAALTIPFNLARFSLRKRLLLIGAVAIAGVAVFYSGAFQQKMFFSGSGTLSDLVSEDSDLRTSGRTVIWVSLWEGLTDKLWWGHGASSTEPIVQSVSSQDHPHNDYLRILYEFGLVGLLLYLLALAAVISQLLILKVPDERYRWWKFGLASSFIPYVVMMSTDNILVYAAYFGNLQFALIGLLLAASRSLPPNLPVRVTLTPEGVMPPVAPGSIEADASR